MMFGDSRGGLHRAFNRAGIDLMQGRARQAATQRFRLRQAILVEMNARHPPRQFARLHEVIHGMSDEENRRHKHLSAAHWIAPDDNIIPSDWAR